MLAESRNSVAICGGTRGVYEHSGIRAEKSGAMWLVVATIPMQSFPDCEPPRSTRHTATRGQIKYSNTGMREGQRLSLTHNHTTNLPTSHSYYLLPQQPQHRIFFSVSSPHLFLPKVISQNRYFSYFFSSIILSCATFHLLVIDDKDDC